MDGSEIWFYSCGFGTGVFSAGGDPVVAIGMTIATGVILSFAWLVCVPAVNRAMRQSR